MNTHSASFARAVALDVGDEHAVRQVDLVGGEPHAFVLVHQLEHLGDHPLELGVDALERPRDVPQRGVRVVNDGETQERHLRWQEQRQYEFDGRGV